nr:immunoglobulin heavy chain junction region [Macaca mulatta]MOW32273.1 immunoglobulin heavy chain junction region [Macaca mulatta]MOW32352.1 immunoglobulin heavy chain junction region [Macaca mulatta]MOW32353.1 immunoglobulin heavy chain junction region [Macaca mulatta]MOW32435.1 immunoglobulin heavy chain junction region [Macaca mulatta]
CARSDCTGSVCFAGWDTGLDSW